MVRRNSSLKNKKCDERIQFSLLHFPYTTLQQTNLQVQHLQPACQAKSAMEDTEGEKMYLEMLNFGSGKMSYEEFLAKARKETD